MTIWKKHIDLERLNATSANTLIEHLGIVYTDVDDKSISAVMPVTSTTHQPLGMLHGGASVVLAETLGSVAANFCVSNEYYCVGLEVNANHIRSIKSGTVTGTATPIHLGATTQVWQTTIVDQRDRLICTSRLTVAVLKRRKQPQT
jgi:uncharacterized protein (TIGR00369 family)